MVAAEQLAASVSLGVHGTAQSRHRREFLAVSPLCQRRFASVASTGGNRPNRSISLCASANGKRPKPCGSGATANGACVSAQSGVTKLRTRQSAVAGAGVAADARRRARGIAGRAVSCPAPRASRCRASAIRCSIQLCRKKNAPAPSAAKPAARHHRAAAPSLIWLSDFLGCRRRRRHASLCPRRRGGPSGAHRRSGGRGFSL